jgi:hypothetical protein
MTAAQAASHPHLRVVEVTAMVVVEMAETAAAGMEDPEVEVRHQAWDLPLAGIPEVAGTEVREEEEAEVEIQYLPPMGMETPMTGSLIVSSTSKWCPRGMAMAKLS